LALAELTRALANGLVEGLIYGSVLGAVAVGLTLIWGVMKVVNLAHGHLVVFGGMLAANLVLLKGADPLVLFFAFIALGAAMGFALYYASIHRIIGKVDIITLKEEMATLMTTFGFGITLFAFHYVAPRLIPGYQTDPGITYTLEIAGVSTIDLGFKQIPVKRIVVAFLGFALAMASYYLVQRTRLGLMIQAVAQDSRALALVGINPVRIKLATTVISAALAVASGVLVLVYSGSINPTTEFTIGPLSFVIVVLGGLGSILGSYIAGILLGIVYQVTLYSTQVIFGTQQQAIALAVAFAILALTLVLRPQGLFGGRR